MFLKPTDPQRFELVYLQPSYQQLHMPQFRMQQSPYSHSGSYTIEISMYTDY